MGIENHCRDEGNVAAIDFGHRDAHHRAGHQGDDAEDEPLGIGQREDVEQGQDDGGDDNHAQGCDDELRIGEETRQTELAQTHAADQGASRDRRIT